MGTMTVTVHFANGDVAPGQEVTIKWGGYFLGIGGGAVGPVTTTQDGIAAFDGAPALESGSGTVTSTTGEEASFTCSTDLFGNGTQTVTVFWNPAQSVINSAKGIASSIWNVIFTLIFVGIIIVIVYVLWKRYGPSKEDVSQALKALPAAIAALA